MEPVRMPEFQFTEKFMYELELARLIREGKGESEEYERLMTEYLNFDGNLTE